MDEPPRYTPPPVTMERGSSALHSQLHRSFWILIQDIEATKDWHDHAEYKYRSKKSQLEALEALIHEFQLTHSTKDSGYSDCTPFTGEQLHKTFSRAWGSRKATSAASKASPWTSCITDWKSSYIKSIRKACDELSAHESLPIYDRNAAISFSSDLVVEGDATEQASHDSTAVGESHDGMDASDLQAAQDNTTDNRSCPADDQNGSVQVVHASKPAAVATNSPIVLLTTGLKPTPEAELRAVRASIHRMPTSPSSSTGQTEFVSPDEDADSLVNSHTEASGSPPAERKRRPDPLGTPTSQKRHLARDTWNKASISAFQADEEKQAEIASWVARHLGDSSRVRAEEPAHQLISTFRFNPGQPPQHNKQTERQGLIALDVSQLEAELENIFFKMLKASRQLMDSVGEVDQEAMPLEQNVSPCTLELHVRCWGTEWRQVRHSLKKSHLLSVPDVVLSLCSAYLFEQVLNCQVWGTQVILESEERLMSGFVGGKHTMKKIHALIAQDAEYQAGLSTYAGRLGEGLWTAIAPHIKRLALEAESHDLLCEDTNESLWRQAFEPALTDAIQHALRLRLILMGTDCEYSFTWPHARQAFDPKSMQTKLGGNFDLTATRAVAFTLFPGLEVATPESNGGEVEPVRVAVVKLL